MTPEQGRAEWQRWASRADELRRKADDFESEMNASGYRSEADERRLARMRGAAAGAVSNRDALREYAPKETT